MTVRTSAISTIPSFSTKLNILLLIIEVEATIALDPSRFVRMNKSLDLARPDTEAASRRVSDGRTAPQAGEQPAPDERRSNSKTALIMLALCMAVFLSALDVTVITTALPTIAAHFNTSVREYSWIGSAYVLASAATVPSSGKISDIFGRKPVLLVANIVFLIGSLICAVAVSIEMLIVGRAFQGGGAGALTSLVNICISDLFSERLVGKSSRALQELLLILTWIIRKRGAYYGMVGATWGIACALGPVVGGALAQKVSWRWCFYINRK